MIIIGKIFSFSAAHRLPHHEGQCKRHHGHNYKLEVEVTGPRQHEGRSKGMVMDFDDLENVVRAAVLSKYDHKNLNEFVGNPTAEVMIEDMAKAIQSGLPKGIELIFLKLWETEKCYAIWTRED